MNILFSSLGQIYKFDPELAFKLASDLFKAEDKEVTNLADWFISQFGKWECYNMDICMESALKLIRNYSWQSLKTINKEKLNQFMFCIFAINI